MAAWSSNWPTAAGDQEAESAPTSAIHAARLVVAGHQTTPKAIGIQMARLNKPIFVFLQRAAYRLNQTKNDIRTKMPISIEKA